MKEGGVLEHWKMKYNPQRDECYGIKTSVPGQREVSVEDLQGPFYLLLIGLVAGFVVFTVEAAWHRRKSCRKKPPSKHGKRNQCFIPEWQLSTDTALKKNRDVPNVCFAK
ncbi:hypothetical protein JTE90_000224 [Oedothorax gibbosus]|uniref:Uncharacterized protein n=1 Tax=Oedothorax gibbosus TaxID=931172 RepID=A0AAV6VAA3_9ARAC|nr:hypothetical protein JTE90_000224 [Oedothorax gibbosus]